MIEGLPRAAQKPVASAAARDLLDLFERIALGSPLPRVRALHMPQPVSNGGKGSAFCALELEDGTLGLSYVSLGDTCRRLADQGAVDSLPGLDAIEILRGCVSADLSRRVLGFAAANAVTRWLFDHAGFVPPSAPHAPGGVAPQVGDHVGMVGLFVPLVEPVLAAGARLTVIELQPELAGERPGYKVTLDPGELQDCNKVICTSTVLLTDTLEHILACCTSADTFAMIGPGAGCLPDPLFEHGVTRIGGSWITNREGVVDALARGVPWSAHTRKFEIARLDYPGIAALLGRLK